jgi:exopolysaccharide production protein ExoZ
MTRQPLWTLQAGRAIAALAVVAYHARAATETFVGRIPVAIGFLPSYGYLGVDFFFVLSGFIIHYVNRDWNPRHYAESRALRVYAPYLPVGVGIALLYTLAPGLSAADRQWRWLATLTLLPTGNTALVVAWTLQFEIMFYVVYGLSKLWGHPFIGVGTWAVVSSLLSWLHPAIASPLFSTLPVEFLFGMAAVELADTKRSTLPATVVAFVVFCVFSHMRELFGLAMALLIVDLVRRERAGQVRVSRWLTFLGAASYSIYLVHDPVTGQAARLFHNWAASFVACFVVGAGAGIAYHLLVERPALRWFRPTSREAALKSPQPSP